VRAEIAKKAKREPLVSVIVNCLNGERYIRECLDSVYAQTYSNWEIVFWDNASTDKSAEIANSYDDRLRYFRGESTIPLGAARNQVLLRARGEFLAFLDCDDLWLAQKLKKQIPLFDDPEVGLVYCDTIFFNAEKEMAPLYSRRRAYTGYCFRDLLRDYSLSMQTVIIRRSALDRLDSYFDETFNMVEDADLFRRIAYTNKLAMVPQPLAKWRMHSESWTWTKNELFAEENKRLIEELLASFPDMQTRYPREVSAFKRKVRFDMAKQKWRMGLGKEARKAIFSDLGSPKMLVLFSMTYMPFTWIECIMNIVSSRARPARAQKK